MGELVTVAVEVAVGVFIAVEIGELVAVGGTGVAVDALVGVDVAVGGT